MSIYMYHRVLKKILGKKKFNELSNYTLKRVNEVFGEKSKFTVRKLVYANTSAVLIIGLIKAKKYDNNKLFNALKIKELQSNEYFVENDIEKFIAEYSEYINLIAKNISKGEK